MNNEHLFTFDATLRMNFPTLCGVDEAGRGPLAGPVCCAAVVLPSSFKSDILNDSKKISEPKRELLFQNIIEQALFYNIQLIDADVIDEINILNATMLGMKNAIEGIGAHIDLALIDGNKCPNTPVATRSVVKGDATSASIAAASILAKVARDRYMKTLDAQFPEYQLAKHKGYPTKLHYEMIEQYGVQDFHRKSFLKKRGIV